VCGWLIVPAQFVGKTILYSLICLEIFVENKLPDVVVNPYNPSTQEAEAVGS
jgi:hypothetical protein